MRKLGGQGGNSGGKRGAPPDRGKNTVSENLGKLTKRSQGKIADDYLQYLDPNCLRGARIGVLRRYIDTPTADPEMIALTEKAIADLKAAGAEIVDPPIAGDVDDAGFRVDLDLGGVAPVGDGDDAALERGPGIQ